jgi:hypothetical protein
MNVSRNLLCSGVLGCDGRGGSSLSRARYIDRERAVVDIPEICHSILRTKSRCCRLNGFGIVDNDRFGGPL